jgi:hypothetical protein
MTLILIWRYTTPDTFEPFSAYQKTTGRKEVPFSGFANESDKPGPRQKLAKFIRGNFFLPDARRKGWNKYAAAKKAKNSLSKSKFMLSLQLVRHSQLT